jgi:membrane protein
MDVNSSDDVLLERLKGFPLVQLLIVAFKEWKADNTSMLGAALAYYTVFSLAPLLLMAIAIAGMVFGEEAARSQISGQIASLTGPNAAKGIEEMIQTSGESKAGGILASVIGVATLLVGASGVFGQLQAAMNLIWDVEPPPKGGLWKLVKDRFLSITMVIGSCFLLLVSLLASAVIAAVTDQLDDVVGGFFLRIADLVLSLGIITVLFAAVFKLTPNKFISWRDCWLGAFATSVLFWLGKTLIGLYIGRSAMGSSYGAAGAILIILLWVYYSAQILFFGAELTKAVAERRRSRQEQASGREASAGWVQPSSNQG